MNCSRAKPLLADYLALRKTDLRIDICKGNIGKYDNCLKDTDAVIAIEVIEHLYPTDLEDLPYNIFGCIKPKLAIFTTPNVEYNVLFNLKTLNGMRHEDHKFEWTRNQFTDWCLNICARFPNYNVSIIGIGKGPQKKKQFGYVSQLATFIKQENSGQKYQKQNEKSFIKADTSNEFRLLESNNYPISNDNRSFNEQLLDNVKYYINRFKLMEDKYFNIENNIFEIPLKDIFHFIYPQSLNVVELKNLLVENNFQINEKDILFIEDSRSEEDDSSTEDTTRVGQEERKNYVDIEEETWD